MNDAELKSILLDLTANKKKDSTPWAALKPPEADGDADIQDPPTVPERFLGFVDAIWVLVTTATETYKERYEGSS